MPSASRPSALHTVHSLTSRVLAVPSGCLPGRPASSAARIGTPVPSRPRYSVGATGAAGGSDHAALVVGDLAPERLGGALDVLGRHVHAGQLAQQGVALREADHRADLPHHARDARGQRRALHAEGRVARTDAGLTRVAVVVGALHAQLAQHAGDALGAPTGVARRGPTAGTRPLRADVIGVVGVEPLLDGARRHRQRPAPHRRLHRLEVEPVGRPRRDQRVDLLDDRRVEGRFEAPFLAASCAAAAGVSSSASAHCSHACQ